MKYTQSYEEVAKARRAGTLDSLLKESVTKAGDNFRVKATIEVPQSLVNKIAKKIKDETGKDAKEAWSEVEMAEGMVEYIYKTFMNEESIPASAITGSEPDAEVGDNPDGVEITGETTSPESAQGAQPAAQTAQPAQAQGAQDLPPVQIQH